MGTFLVTGGAGFIGSHVVEALLRQEHRVRVLDDVSSGSLSNLSDRVELLRGDVSDAKIVKQALDGVDGCFHLAAIASVERCMHEWVDTHRTNLTGTITLLDAISKQKSAYGRRVPFVYASSAAVYGDGSKLPLRESVEKRPVSAYGADKYGCELHAAIATYAFGTPTVGLRFFNVYGPRQDPASPYSGVISIFCGRLLRGAPIDIYGDGEQTRYFIYVDDVVRALLNAMALDLREPAVFNVCTGTPVSVLDLARCIADLTGREPTIRFQPARSGEIRHSVGSPILAREALALSESTQLRDGLKRVLEWLRNAGQTY